VLQIMTGSITSALFLLAFFLGLSVGLIIAPGAGVRAILEKNFTSRGSSQGGS
jgi:hypothetical protein